MPSKDFAARRNPVIAGCTATGVLKILALVFMFIDHAGKMLFPQIAEMRMLGRIAFPLYCWCAGSWRTSATHALRAEISGAANADWAGVAADLHGRAQSQLESAEHFSDAARRAVRRVGLEGEKAAQPHLGADSGTLRGAAAGGATMAGAA